MKKKGNTNVRGRVVHKTKGKRTVEILAEEFGESTKQIQRYLKLTELIPELLTKLHDVGSMKDLLQHGSGHHRVHSSPREDYRQQAFRRNGLKIISVII